MPTDLEPVLERILEDYTQVEPPPESMRVWMERRTQPLPAIRFLFLPAPAWAAIALTLLLLLGITWYRGRVRPNPRPILANEHTVLVPAQPQDLAPPTDEQKRLIQLLQTNPAALATQQPANADHNKKVKHP